MASKKAPPAGKHVVEVKSGSTRIMARRFATDAEARDFWTRTLAVHAQKSNRDGKPYDVSYYTTKDARSKGMELLLEHAEVRPVK